MDPLGLTKIADALAHKLIMQPRPLKQNPLDEHEYLDCPEAQQFAEFARANPIGAVEELQYSVERVSHSRLTVRRLDRRLALNEWQQENAALIGLVPNDGSSIRLSVLTELPAVWFAITEDGLRKTAATPAAIYALRKERIGFTEAVERERDLEARRLGYVRETMYRTIGTFADVDLIRTLRCRLEWFASGASKGDITPYRAFANAYIPGGFEPLYQLACKRFPG